MSTIAEIRTWPVRLAGDTAYQRPPEQRSGPRYEVRPPWRSLYADGYESFLVRITADDGTVGWGEALAPVAPEVLATIVDDLLTPALLGADALRVVPLHSRLSGLMRERGHLTGHQADALAAVDIALWDLAGRLLGRPVHELLGGRFRSRIATYLSGLPRDTDDERAQLAAEWATRGVSAVKLHLGNGVDADLSTVDAVAAAAPGMRIAVDAHWQYDVPAAQRLGLGLAERNGWFLEAPLAPEDVEGHAILARALTIPIAVGETFRNRYEVAGWLRNRALDICQIDVGRTGLTEAMAISTLCSAAHIALAPHHSTGLGVALAAGLHLCAAAEDVLVFEFQAGTLSVAQRILRSDLHGGPVGFEIPHGPGLGVEVAEETLI